MADYKGIDKKHQDKPAQNDTARLLATALDEWKVEQQSDLPPPMPLDSLEAARWWLQHQEPERPGETRLVPCGDNGTRSELGYLARTRNAAYRWLAMKPDQRSTVIAGIEDHVPYRGDEFEIYLRIWSETERMREIGSRAYAMQTKARVGALMASIKGARC